MRIEVESNQLSQEEISSSCKHIKEKFPLDNCHVAACDYAAQATVETHLEEVPHKFKCGTDGLKVKSITVRITVPETFVLQAHTGTEEEYGHAMLEQLVSDFCGHLENADSDDEPEDEEAPDVEAEPV